jgi:hypothetical protein
MTVKSFQGRCVRFAVSNQPGARAAAAGAEQIAQEPLESCGRRAPGAFDAVNLECDQA